MPTCHDIFNTARAERAKYTLTKGRYKLDEARHAIEDWQKLVVTVANRVRSGGVFGEDENLGPCMGDEHEVYLEELPDSLANLVGYNILPAIAALEGDGVPKAEVQRLLSRAESDAKRLLAECEAVKSRLNGGIDHEYGAMRRGESRLHDLLAQARAMTHIKQVTSGPANA